MIYGIGTDIVEIERIEKVFKKHKDFFPSRILSQKEVKQISELKTNDAKTRQIAKLFCVKEAFSKALRTGIRGDICFKEIQIIHDDLGAPSIELLGNTKKYVSKKIKGAKIHLSLSDEKETVVSFVIIEY